MKRSPIPYGRQSISKQDIEAVVEVLNSDWLTQGPVIERFEQAVATHCGAKYAVAVSSATAALHISCLAAGLGPGDSLWTSPNTFVASSNCALYCGARVDFVDIDPKTYNLSVDELETKLKRAEKLGKLPKVIVPVHFSGQSCEMSQIHELAAQYEIRIIEDASHAIGGSYRQSKIGSCLHSDMAVFSFHPVKIITTGEGGMVVTNNEELYQRLLLFRSHGITRNPLLMTTEAHGPWYYQQLELGYNYRMTDIQAALGISQMQSIDKFISRRHEIADKYDMGLANLPLSIPWQHQDTFSAYHLYVIRLKLNDILKSHRQVFENLRDKGINVNLHYIPVHIQPYYERMGFREGDFPYAEEYYREAISLPIFYGLKDNEQDYIMDTLTNILSI